MTPGQIVVAVIAVAAASVFAVAAWPSMTRERGGKILSFFALFVFPTAVALSGGWWHLERSKETQFCLSCHTMSEHGRSLFIDDPSYLPAAHYQNNRVPRDQACYTCHKDYTMYGDIAAKMRGLRHVYVQYLGNRPEPGKIKLYTPYNNRECLHCHRGARSFEEASAHQRKPGQLAEIKSNTMSCLNGKCHEFAHDIESIKDSPMWKPGTDEAAKTIKN
jgi:cytochrome c-type protein NapC